MPISYTYASLERVTDPIIQPKLDYKTNQLIPDYTRQGYAYHTTYQYPMCYNGNGYAKAVCVPGAPVLKQYQLADPSHPANYTRWSGYLTTKPISQ